MPPRISSPHRSAQIPALLAFCLLAGAASAALIASDDFEGYTPGGLNALNGGTGWGGAWSANPEVSVVTNTLSYSSGTVSLNGGSQALQFVPNEGGSAINDGIISRALGSSQTGTVYFSMLFQDSINPNLPDNDFIQWGFDTGTGNPNASIMRRNGTFQSRSTTTTSNSEDSTITSTVGSTYLLVFKATKSGANYDSISLFVNPDSQTEPGTPDAEATANSGLSSFDNFLARSAFHEDGDSFLIDELTIATTFAEVVPIPEPSSALLGLLGLIPLLRRRR